jgi:hypothetical protein
MGFKKGSAGLADKWAIRSALQLELVSAGREAELREVSDDWYAARTQLAEQIRKELIEDLRAAGYQDVGMATLRDTAPMLDRSQQPVAVQHCDSGVRLGQYARSEQPSHASAQDHRVITDLAHLDDLLGCDDARPTLGVPASVKLLNPPETMGKSSESVRQGDLPRPSLSEPLRDLVVNDRRIELDEESGILRMRLGLLNVLACHGPYGIHGLPQAQDCELRAVLIRPP